MEKRDTLLKCADPGKKNLHKNILQHRNVRKIDTSVEMNILLMRIYKSITPKPKLHRTSVKLNAYIYEDAQQHYTTKIWNY